MSTEQHTGETSDPNATALPGGGLIGTFVRHATAANLLMAALIIVGLFSVQRLNTQFFPTLAVPVITVSVVWSGASAEDVETNIIEALEPELRFLDGVEEVTSISREGSAVVTLEFEGDADMQKAQSDVEQAVERVTTLPEGAEDPEISRAAFYEPVAQIALSGRFSEATLKSYAKQMRDGLLDAGIDRVTFLGLRSEEIEVAISEYDLRRLDVSLSDVATRINANTDDSPSGILEGAVDVQLRALSSRRTPEELAGIEIKSTAGGQKVFLGDIATIEQTFDDDEKQGFVTGERAIRLTVQRAVTADTLKTMERMFAYVDTAKPALPQSLAVEVYDVRGELVAQRLGILVKNGLQGLLLVLIVLFIFLDSRIAFWTALGIPIAFLATLAVMLLTGQSINMISMFALILMLGIIVDDAIVVGEHTATRQAMGDSPMVAAERGARRMFLPVMAATLTTMAAFFPITLIGGRIGEVMVAIPLVVMAVLIASIIECFLILPGHLRHSGLAGRKPNIFRRVFDRGLNSFRDGPYRAFVGLTYSWRYTTVASCVAVMVIAVGLLAGGRVGFSFFPSPEPENISANVVFGAGTPRETQVATLGVVEAALDRAEAKLVAELGGSTASSTAEEAVTPSAEQLGFETPAAVSDGLSWLNNTLGLGGAAAGKDNSRLVVFAFTTLGSAGRAQGENLAELNVQLTSSEERSVPTKTIVRAWREELPELPGVEQISLSERRVGPPSRDVDVRLLNAPIANLKAAAEDLARQLEAFPGVSGITDDLPYGRPELVMSLTPRGTAMGFTGDSVGQQVRNAFDGAIATRFARGDEEITVRVLRRQDIGGREALSQLTLRTPSGQRVPITEVVTFEEKQGFSIIQRRDGQRTVSVVGDIDDRVSSVIEVVERLERDVMAGIVERHRVDYAFKGRDEERRESFADLGAGGLLALSLIYIILAWVFASYWKPLAVMAIIPFGLVGAIVGHMAMDMKLTIISLIGLLGLSGILVNDSIILISQVKERLEEGQSTARAAVGASQDRFRAVLLTSLTTIGGLLPLMFEESRQAQFLIPMAITLVYGLAVATILVLVLVPSLIGIGGDIGNLAARLKRLWTGENRPPKQASGALAPAE